MLIRQGQKVWRSLRYAADMDPYNLVEFVMLLLALPITFSAWLLRLPLEYWIVGLGLAVGSAACCFVRESLLANPRNRARQIIALLLILICSYAIVDTCQSLA